MDLVEAFCINTNKVLKIAILGHLQWFCVLITTVMKDVYSE